MKNFVLLLSLLILFGCGPSDEEKQNTAIITCNIMSESKNMDASLRIKEINQAREKINEDPFLGKDKEIKEAFKYDLCEKLVLNDKNYQESLNFLKEQERIDEEKAAEEARIAEEKAAEEARIAQEKEIEEERKIMNEWVEKNKKIILRIKPIKFKRFANSSDACLGWGEDYEHPLVICYDINNFGGFDGVWEVIFKNGYILNRVDLIIGGHLTVYDFHIDDEKLLSELELAPTDLAQYVSEVNFYVQGASSIYLENNNLTPSELSSIKNKTDSKYYFSQEGLKFQIYPPNKDD